MSEDLDDDEPEDFLDNDDLSLITNKPKRAKKKNSYSKRAVWRSARLRKSNQ